MNAVPPVADCCNAAPLPGRRDPMVYRRSMEAISSDIMDRVLDLVAAYDPDQFTAHHVERALNATRCSVGDFAVLLSPAALPFLDRMESRAEQETSRFFGRTRSLFTPLYIANYCDNSCTYCGFNCANRIKRAKLSIDEIIGEMDAIRAQGLDDILILTGESRIQSSLEFIGEAVRLAAKRFSNVGLEIYPLNSDEYRRLHDLGANSVSVYQETYDPTRYAEVHPFGPKRVFPYRFNAQERALLGGVRSVAFGALLGLGDFRKDAFAAGLHACFVGRKYPDAKLSLSPPRLRPYVNNAAENSGDVHEPQLLQVMLAYRLFLPEAGLTISTREEAAFRDHVIGCCATRMSAGVSVGVGGHETEEKGDGQFEIADRRSAAETIKMLKSKALLPVSGQIHW